MQNRPICSKIIHYRQLTGYTPEKLAEILGMDVDTYIQKERNIDLDLMFLNNIATILEIDIKDLFSDSTPILGIRRKPILITHLEENFIEKLRVIPREVQREIFNLADKAYSDANKTDTV